MNANTSHILEPFGRLPSEIRSMIFAYVIQDTIETYLEPSDYSTCVLRNEFQTRGFDTGAARAHLMESPWVTLNKQYCAEYLEVFVREAELTTRYPSQWRVTSAGDSNGVAQSTELDGPGNVLQLIISRFDIAAPYAGIGTSSQKLLSRIRGICFSYQYPGAYFQHGYGTIERPQYPHEDCLEAPLRLLRQYHENYNIPSNRLSVEISYGEPSSAFAACLGNLGRAMLNLRTISLKAVRARIQAVDRDASVAVVDRELEILEEAVENLTAKLRSQSSRLCERLPILRLERMIDSDAILLRVQHLRATDQVTQLWKAYDSARETDESAISLPPPQHPIWRSNQVSSLVPHQASDNYRGFDATISDDDDDQVELDDLSPPLSDHPGSVCVTIDNEETGENDSNNTAKSLHASKPSSLPSCCGLTCIIM